MHKISLRIRITILVGLVLVLLTTALTIFSILGANHYFVTPQLKENNSEELDRKILDSNIMYSNQMDSNFVDGSQHMGTGTMNNISAKINVTAAQKGFSLHSIAVLIAIIFFGLGVTYWMMGRALKPLTLLSETIHDINEHNLSKSIEGYAAKDEVGSITTSFNGMLHRLRSSFEQQKNFAASAAHELKTPLTTMKTAVQVLSMENSPSAEDYSETISVIEQNIDRLIYTVNDLLLLSSEGKAELDEEISLRTLFYQIEKEQEELISSKNIRCILPQKDYVLTGSSLLLRSVFNNIFENAVKYNKDGGTVEVIVQKTGDDKIAISICDTGIGMTEEDTARIFEPFFRADSSRLRQIPGNGLGMSVIHGIIEKHGGEINIESKINIGTKITVKLANAKGCS